MAVAGLRRRRTPPRRGPEAEGDSDDEEATKTPLPTDTTTAEHEQELSNARVFTSAITILVLAATSAALGVDHLAEDILTASIRTFVQLSCLGAILSPLFKTNHSGLAVAYVFCFMVPLAAYEATARSSLTFPGAYRAAICGLASGVASMLSVAIFAVVRPKPWHSPRHVIPLGGMLISNALSGTALALGDLLDELHNRSERVEVMLAMGATHWEAVWPSVTAVVQKGLMPQLNSMNVIGLVAIPGMMTGSILGGVSPVRAARYQIMIMYLIAASTGMAAGVTTVITVGNLFGRRGVYLGDKIVENSAPRVSQLLVRSAGSKRLLGNEAAEELNQKFGADVSPVELHSEESKPFPMPTVDASLELDISGTIAFGRPFSAKLSLYPGVISCLLGPSGIGKSTLLRSVAELSHGGTIDTISSTILLAGKMRSKYRPSDWRRRVMYVPQGIASSLPGSPHDLIEGIRNLKSRRRAGKKGGRALNARTVADYLLSWGVTDAESAVNRPWSDLSGGEAQRALLAIALAAEPYVLLLDEPTSALDGQAKRRVEESLGGLGCAVLVVTHDEEQALRIGKSRWRLVEVKG